jgi:pyruvate formate lyase activating enzyme
MEGIIFNIQRYSLDDGPGMRTTVFVKGCPLSCLWCSNPESQDSQPMVTYRYTSCKGCGTCVKTCPKNAVTLDGDGVHIDRTVCDRCGECVKGCVYDALRLTGEVVTVEKLMKTIKRDKVYYQTSGGGVTCSGGEILMQPDFVAEIFRQCHAEGIHTCADTCGYGPEEAMRKILEHSDLVYFDIKHMNADRHREYTGVDNEIILKNLSIALASGVSVVIRVPLIPEHNDSEENLRAMAGYVSKLGSGIDHVCILPYHNYGANKYRMIDKTYPLEGLRKLTPEEEERAKNIIEGFGLKCKISK